MQIRYTCQQHLMLLFGKNVKEADNKDVDLHFANLKV